MGGDDGGEDGGDGCDGSVWLIKVVILLEVLVGMAMMVTMVGDGRHNGGDGCTCTEASHGDGNGGRTQSPG